MNAINTINRFVDVMLERADVHDYEDMFKVVVFGKVKAGKSYTGNFIMGNVIRDMGVHTHYDWTPRPTVKIIDRVRFSESQDEGEEFFRDYQKEATSTIQLFRLGGMVWIDTPGIGSITEANEILAKDFVDNADLIVYMMNSDAGGTKQDFEEVKALYGKRKRFLFLLTQSDTEDYDIDDDGNIIAVLAPKKDADRKSMEDYICNTLIESGINDFNRGREILTISTKLALEGLKTNDEGMFDASNMKQFFDALISAAKTKTSRTWSINATIDDVIDRLIEAQAAVDKSKKSLVEAMKMIAALRDDMRA